MPEDKQMREGRHIPISDLNDIKCTTWRHNTKSYDTLLYLLFQLLTQHPFLPMVILQIILQGPNLKTTGTLLEKIRFVCDVGSIKA